MPPKVRGELSELEAHLAPIRAGYVVLTAPYTDGQRYDCVLDHGAAFRRVQVKTGKLTDDGGGIVFPTCSTIWNTGAVHDHAGAADLLVVQLAPERFAAAAVLDYARAGADAGGER